MVPVLILLLKEEEYLTAFLVFIFAGISDGLDGYIAKRFNYVSQLGAILDPLADKFLLVSSYVMLTVLNHIPFWLLLTVAFRDLLIIGGYMIYVSLHRAVQVRPSYLSKFNTFMQISLVVVVLAVQAFAYPLPLVVEGLVVVVFITTVVSGLHYLWHGVVKREIEAAAGSGESGE